MIVATKPSVRENLDGLNGGTRVEAVNEGIEVTRGSFVLAS